MNKKIIIEKIESVSVGKGYQVNFNDKFRGI